MSAEVRSPESILAATPRVTVGAWRCPPAHPLFRDSGPTHGFLFVFPRTSLWIQHEGQAAFPVDANVVTIYNRGQAYTRLPAAPEGDRCEFFSVDHESALDAVRERDPSVEERPLRPFPFSHGPSDGTTYLRQRELVEALSRGLSVDALDLEERVMELLDRVLARAYDAWRPRWRRRPSAPTPRELEAAWRAQAVLALRYREPVSLESLAGEVGLSRYRLCRVFRKATGTTLHAYREQLRLRAGLETLPGARGDLTALALDLGYSSHSHFSANFRRALGATPTDVGRRLRAT